MEEITVKSPILIYTEETPNPDSLKFVMNKMLFQGATADFKSSEDSSEWSDLATALFTFPYIKNVYICNNFVSITKEINYDWAEIQLKIKEFLKDYIQSEKSVIKEEYKTYLEELKNNQLKLDYSGEEIEIVKKIKDLIDSHVKPAVERDGGNIEFQSYNKGIVTVLLQGSCSGCPSSTITLKSGIEGLLKRMVPEVTEVVSEMG